MLHRRQFLSRGWKGVSLIAASSIVPSFVARTAWAVEPGKDQILVVLEMTGGNDGLNTVIPYGDDLYHQARPTLRKTKETVVRVDDLLGLNPALRGLNSLLEANQLAIVQGVGYPNPNRSHFESMDVWQSADPTGKLRSGWLGRALADVRVQPGRIPAFQIGEQELPLALAGAVEGIPTLNPDKPFGLVLEDTSDQANEERKSLGGDAAKAEDPHQAHRQLIRNMSGPASAATPASLLQFVQRTSLGAYDTADRLQAIVDADFVLPEATFAFIGEGYKRVRQGLVFDLNLVARMIQADLGTRIYYVSIDGFDTHGAQEESHRELLSTTGNAIGAFFEQLKTSGDAKRVVLMTYSEFGRRVQENGSKGTDHGSASCQFVVGPAVKGGLIGKHPSLAADDLDDGDLKYHTDFRQVYATLLDRWLGCDSKRILGGQFEHVALLK
jgi:uncharacterized protein (DUF1501 family)